MFRFLHSSDLHLGKRFGNLPEDLRGRLREARHAALEKLALHARAHGAETILLAGDTFDTETPTPDVRRQMLAEMAHHAPLRWIILPGNHDSLQATQLWDSLWAEAPANVVLVIGAEPLSLAPGAVLLPAPCTSRRPGRDLTAWMDNAATEEGALRIGLAHGAIRDFSEDGVGLDVLAPDRAIRAGLDYLALGDWHGALSVDPRTRYSGTPEPDRFKHDQPGQALLISLEGPGATPEITALDTATFVWQSATLHLVPDEDVAAGVGAILPEGPARRRTLLNIAASGRVRVENRLALEAAITHAAPEFALLNFDGSGLETEVDSADLDSIDRSGALRDAAEALFDESSDETRSNSERATAQAALRRLFSFAQKAVS